MEGELIVPESDGHRVRMVASCVLENRKKEYGAKRCVDGDSSTCWNSGPSTRGYVYGPWVGMVVREGGRGMEVQRVALVFQGGFVGRRVQVWGGRGAFPRRGLNGGGEGVEGGRLLACVDLEDSNLEQHVVVEGGGEEKVVDLEEGGKGRGIGGEDADADDDDDDNEGGGDGKGVRWLALRFPVTSDFYGRVILYRLEVYGTWVELSGEGGEGREWSGDGEEGEEEYSTSDDESSSYGSSSS